jgi:DNA invertase Pin-like site-specific DNA recombinase
MNDQESNLTQSPAVYGYAWVENSTEASQMLNIQIQTLRKNNVERDHIFTDIVGRPVEFRPGWQSLSKKLELGDTVCIVPGYGQTVICPALAMSLELILPWQGVQVLRQRPTKGIFRGSKNPKGHPKALNAADVRECRRLRAEGASLRKIAEKMGCSPGTVKNVLDGVGPYAEERLDAQG